MAGNHTNTPPTNAALSVLLTDVADSITNVAAHEAEQVIRLAAQRLAESDTPAPPAVVQLISQLRTLARITTDEVARTTVRGLLGDELAN
jgi:hypothetical protein